MVVVVEHNTTCLRFQWVLCVVVICNVRNVAFRIYRLYMQRIEYRWQFSVTHHSGYVPVLTPNSGQFPVLFYNALAVVMVVAKHIYIYGMYRHVVTGTMDRRVSHPR